MQRVYTLEELARFLHRQPKELRKLAEKNIITGRKIQGSWSFALPDVVLWMEREMTQVDDNAKARLENAVSSVAEDHEEVDFRELLSEDLVDLSFPAKTRSSVIADIAKIAENSGRLWDAEAMAKALREREEMASTALENGVAILHPRRPLPEIVGEDFLVVAVAPSGVPFGGGHANLTDVFFLLCCRSDAAYLRSLGRLARAINTPGVLDKLREAQNPGDAVELLATTAESLE